MGSWEYRSKSAGVIGRSKSSANSFKALHNEFNATPSKRGIVLAFLRAEIAFGPTSNLLARLTPKANSHDKSEQHIEEKILQTVPFALGYTFDYGRFDKTDLQIKAKSTLGNFFGFVRQTFDGLLEIGRYHEVVAKGIATRFIL
jgi:hypothetical protein